MRPTIPPFTPAPARPLLAAILGLTLAVPLAARATAPSDLETRVLTNIVHHCRNDRTLRCEEIDATGFAFTGCECTRDPGVCSADPSLHEPDACVIDFVPGAVLHGTVTAVADDFTADNIPDGTGGDDNRAVTLIMTFPRGGDRALVIAETFYGADDDTVAIGGWNAISAEDDIFTIVEFFGMIPVKSMLAIQDRLRQFALAEFGIDAVPLLTQIRRVRQGLETDESPNGNDTDLASVAQYRLTIRFANGTAPAE